MNISIYALHLSFGGVEKYVITLANMLCNKHNVEIISTYKIDEKPAFHLDSRVKVTYLLNSLKPNKDAIKTAIKEKNIKNIFKEAIVAIRVLIEKKRQNIISIKNCKSDVIISTRIFHNKLIGKYAKNAIKITGEHNHHNNNEKYINEVINSCKGFDYFIPISKELCDFYREPLSSLGVKTEYIKFCIDKNENYVSPNFNTNDIISVGRLSSEKGMADLIKVFAKVKETISDAKLHIVGDGAERESIESLIKDERLTDSVILHGYREKSYIYSLLPKNSLYVMTSFTESFGLVLLEAMSCGIPCIAFSSAQGAHEIIENGKNGFLIDNRDIETMRKIICETLNNKELLANMSKEALQTADEFSFEKTCDSWLTLMDKIENKK